MVAFHFPLKHPARLNIRRLDRDQVIPRQGLPHPCKQTVGLAQPCPIDGIANRTGIGKEGELPPPLDVIRKRHFGVGTEAVVLRVQQQPSDGHQLTVAVIGKIQMMRHP